jgi:hypothetical protein
LDKSLVEILQIGSAESSISRFSWKTLGVTDSGLEIERDLNALGGRRSADPSSSD